MCVPVPEAEGNKLKRERRLVSEQENNNSNGQNENKIVKVWPLDQPAHDTADKMHGRSKIADVRTKDDGTGKLILSESLSDDDKG